MFGDWVAPSGPGRVSPLEAVGRISVLTLAGVSTARLDALALLPLALSNV